MGMSSAENNLFSALWKWAARDDENFITEAFAYVLRHLLEHETGKAQAAGEQVGEDMEDGVAIQAVAGRLDLDKWVNELDLFSEDVHFPARSAASQRQCVEKFLTESLDIAEQLRR